MKNPIEYLQDLGFSDTGLPERNGWYVYRHKSNRYFVGFHESYTCEDVDSAFREGEMQFSRNI
ncbi:hypothetical protein [Enterococcus gilvus]|uniref:hypothetical protein n=1 Tax=Enterococcus gilvus TaxID=160453 RepID=UPI00345E97FD